MSETLMTPQELCDKLRVQMSWVYDAAERGVLPAVRVGRRLRFRPSDIEKYLDGTATGEAA